jgi:hypothetical protein
MVKLKNRKNGFDPPGVQKMYPKKETSDLPDFYSYKIKRSSDYGQVEIYHPGQSSRVKNQ